MLGVLIGVLPGLGGANGVAILLPLTFSMSPTSAIVMLSCIYWGALFGGAITSILFNIPGEPWSVATTFDGYPLAQKGQAGARADGGLHLVLHRCLRGGGDDHLPGAAGGQVRAEVRRAGVLRGLPADLLQLRRHGQGLALQDRWWPWRWASRWRRSGMDTVTGQLRLTFGSDRTDARLRLPDRGDRPVRHRRDPAVDGRRAEVLGQDGQDQHEGRLGDLEGTAALLGHLAAQFASSASGWASRRAAPRRPRS